MPGPISETAFAPPTAGISASVSAELRERALREAAQAYEAGFLAEMLRASGFGQPRGTLGGGAGEEQFASFLVQAHADALAERGGVGLAEAIFRSLAKRSTVGQ